MLKRRFSDPAGFALLLALTYALLAPANTWAQDWNALLQQTYTARKQGNMAQARQLSQSLLQKAEVAKQTEVMGFMLSQLGYLALTEKQYPQAQQYLERAYTIQKAQYTADHGSLFQTMVLLCDAYYQDDEFDAALQWMDRVQAVPGKPEALGQGKAHAMLLKGVILTNRKEYDAARQALQLVLIPVTMTDPQLRQALAEEQKEADNILARLDRQAQAQTDALATAGRLLGTQALQATTAHDVVSQLLKRAREAMDRKQFEQARPLALEALKLAEQQDSPPQIVNTLACLGTIHFNSAQYPDAVDAFGRILSYETQPGLLEPELQVWTRRNLADALYRLRRFPDALAQYQELSRLTAQQTSIDTELQGIMAIRTKEIREMDQGPDYFDLMGFPRTRWHDKTRTIRIYVKPGDKLPDWNARYLELLREAFAEWQVVLDDRLTFEFLPKKKNADVLIAWQKKATPQRGQKGAELMGYNTREVLDNRHLIRSDIDLALHDMQDRPISEAVLKSIMLHEIGHMLGLEHSNNPNDLMYVSVDAELLKEALIISERDQATLRKLYASRADITNPPEVPLTKAETHLQDLYDRQHPWMSGNPDGMMWSPFNIRR